MKNIVLSLLFLLFLSACAGPRYTGSAIEKKGDIEVVIVHDKETRTSFLDTMENWLYENNYKSSVAPDSSKHEVEKLTLEYVGYWKWDLVLYLSRASIKAYNKGQRVGEVEFKSPNSLNLNKFGDAEDRIAYMMDIIFGKITVDEANKKINPNYTD